MRFAYAQPKTPAELQEAIDEAWHQAHGLFIQSEFVNNENLLKECRRWIDRAQTLELELELLK